MLLCYKTVAVAAFFIYITLGEVLMTAKAQNTSISLCKVFSHIVVYSILYVLAAPS